MAEMSISRAVSVLADRAPGAVALRGTGAAADDEVVTRRELDLLTNRIARRWVGDGLAADDVVAISCPDPVDLVLASVATWKAGATPMPLGPDLSAPERSALLEPVRPARVETGPLDRCVATSDSPVPDAAASSWKVAASSGSTGRPKRVRATAPARIDPDRAVADFVPRDAVQLVAAPPHAGAGFVYATRGLMTGHELVLMRAEPGGWDPGAWLALLAAHRATWAVLSPTTMRAVAEHPGRAGADVSSLTSVLHLGAPCPERLKRTWLEWLGPSRVVEVYAGTESAGVAMIGGEDWLAHPGSVGRGVGGSRFRVIGADGRPVRPGETGEVLMRRERAAYEYLGGGAPRRDDGWHSLGDVGRMDSDGWLWVLDRLADCVRLGDVLLVPAVLEAVLEEHPAVRSCLAVRRPDGLAAVVETDDLGAVEAWAQTRLDPSYRPVRWMLARGPLRDVAGKARRADWA